MDVFFNIIVVSYNAGDKLGKTLESIKKQTYGNYRVIMKDGLSDDHSVERACATYGIDASGKSVDGKITLLRGKDRGIYDAMNIATDYLAGLEKKEADPERLSFVYFLNCGDYLANPEVLERVRQQILQHRKSSGNPAPYICYGDIYECKTGQRVSSNPKIDDFACYRNVPNHQACFYESTLITREKFDTQWEVRADYEHFLRCFYKANAQTIYMPFIIAEYEGGGFSETPEGRKKSERERRWIIAMYQSPSQVRKYDFIRAVSLAPLRTKLAENPKTAGAYNKIKSMLYRES